MNNRPAIGTPFIEVDGLGVATVVGDVFRDVSFSANTGQVVALFGTEGCGKTSLLLTIGGRMKPLKGKAIVGGFDVDKQYRKVRDLSGITIIERVNDVPEYLLVRDIVSAELALEGKKSNRAAVDAYLDEWGFRENAATKFCDLERNDRTIFEILLACVNDPQLLLIDDLTYDLTHHRSVLLVESLRGLARMRGMCVVFGTHEYDVAKYADGIVVMSEKAENQRLRVLNDQGASALCPVVGAGNGVQPAPFEGVEAMDSPRAASDGVSGPRHAACVGDLFRFFSEEKRGNHGRSDVNPAVMGDGVS